MFAYNAKRRRYAGGNSRKGPVLKLLFAVILFAAMVIFFHLPKFRVKNIFVQNNSDLRSQVQEETKKALRDRIFLISPADNYFLLRKKMLANAVSRAVPAVKIINFDREFPDTLIVRFEERKKAALWCQVLPPPKTAEPPPEIFLSEVSDCYFIDEDGVAFEKRNNGLEFSPVFLSSAGEKLNPGDAAIEKKLLRSIFEFLENAKNYFRLEAEKITLEENSYKIYFKKGWFVLMDGETNFKNAFENLKLILDSQVKEKIAELEYVDLRFVNKVFYK